MPNYDLGLLITLNIALTLTGFFGAMISVWVIIRQAGRNARELSQESREGMREIATITREVAFMIRRQYADIDRDLSSRD